MAGLSGRKARAREMKIVTGVIDLLHLVHVLHAQNHCGPRGPGSPSKDAHEKGLHDALYSERETVPSYRLPAAEL